MYVIQSFFHRKRTFSKSCFRRKSMLMYLVDIVFKPLK